MKARTPTSHEQFALPFLDTTSLSGGIGLYGGFSAAKRTQPATTAQPDKSETDEATAPRRLPSPRMTIASLAIASSPRPGRAGRQPISPRSGFWPRLKPRAATLARMSRSGSRASPRSALPTSPTSSSAAMATNSRPRGKTLGLSLSSSSRARIRQACLARPSTRISRRNS